MKKIDLLDVKIWNRKKERWFQVKPESLLLFEENIGKCWRCKFHVKHCQCKEKITFKQRIANFKEKIKMWVRNTSTKYHKFRYQHFFGKYEKYYEKAEEHFTSYRDLQESQVNWKKVNPKGFTVKLNGGL